MNNKKKLIGTSILAAITASLCCITPVLALLAGTSGIASTFSWIEPFRPYLIGLTVLVLACAWYLKLKPKTKAEIDCECEDEKPKFINSKGFLFLVTLLAGAMLAFPRYSHVFYPTPDTSKEIVYVEQSNVKEIRVDIEGMTCSGCEAHIESEVNKLDGIIKVNADYESANTIVKYDETKVDLQKIETAILSTGYKIVK
ncbi:mercuric transport protein MerTP [Maribacter algarum]|uniref:Mercuric transport protein MerT n=1 Tax=Maribacter algarum (ex Zhang et al. 2020) TaxID=2578118 RepID=A0A5S3PSB4_9FLAO|nr:mercuric transport protein MerTP [Maribacter algarum]TMM57861.1 mercuric transport protein MerTP [Maribacter algarum]